MFCIKYYFETGCESYIVAKVDGVNEIVDMTDHTQGENPYIPTFATSWPNWWGCGCSSGGQSSGGSCSTDASPSQGGGGCGCQ